VLTELIRFEWRYHTRQPAFIAAAALFFVFGFVLTASAFGPATLAVTAPWLVMESIAFVSLTSVFAIAVFVANGAIRDTEHRMAEIIFCTPVGRFHYLFGRFGGAFAAAMTTLAMAPLGMMLASRMPWLPPERLGALSPVPYVWAFVVMVVPTLLFATSLLFAFAVLTRSPLATYAASVVIYVLYMFCAALTNSPLMAQSKPGTGGAGALGSLLDPFGLTSFFDVTRYWPVADKNQRYVALEGVLLLNRAVWIAVSLVILAIAYRAFRFRLLRRTREKPLKRESAPATATDYRRVPQTPRFLSSFFSATKLEASAALRGLPTLLLGAMWFVLALTEIRSDILDGEYHGASYPATALILGSLEPPIFIIGMIIVIYYASELFWREQRFRVSSLIDATPVRGLAMVLSKWMTLTIMIAAVIAIGIAAGVLFQLTSGWFEFSPLLWLSLFWFSGMPLALYAAAAVLIHAVSPGKYAGLVLVLLFVLATRMLPMAGLEHPLWRFGAGPGVDYSDLYGFSDAAASFNRLMLHWTVFAAAFLTGAAIVRRRLNEGVRARMRRLKPVAAAIPLAFLTGGWIYANTDYVSARERLDRRADYEKSHRALAAAPQPRVEALKAQVDFYPERRRVDIAAHYTLLNDTHAPILALHVSIPRDDGVAMHRVDLATPLQPGARIALKIVMNREELAEENGSLVMSSQTFPSLGYRGTYEIVDARERAKRGLGSGSFAESDDPDNAAAERFDQQRIAFEAVVSTSADQTAIAPGNLLRTWTANGRRHFHYSADAPILNRTGFLSARYAIARRNDVSIAYHPRHGANVEAMLDTAVKTLDYCSRAFGPYPHTTLRLVEVPSSAPFGGFALPGTILLNEKRAFLIQKENAIDLVARRVAHEVAHQWFGYRLVAENRGGATFLTESLTKYAELMVLERMHGREHVARLLDWERDRYLAGRAGDERRERPLVNAGAQPYLYYSKGALVLYAMRDLISEEKLNAAIRRFIEEEDGRPTATTADFLRHVRAVSTATQYAQIERWMTGTAVLPSTAGNTATPAA
jgi:ABC-2 type transport system permease protein